MRHATIWLPLIVENPLAGASLDQYKGGNNNNNDNNDNNNDNYDNNYDRTQVPEEDGPSLQCEPHRVRLFARLPLNEVTNN